MTEGVIPSSRSLEERNKRSHEEERRTAYVAVTRSMKELYLTESEGIGKSERKKFRNEHF